jgi:hypothetical protein
MISDSEAALKMLIDTADDDIAKNVTFDFEGPSLLYIAASRGFKELLDIMIAKGANLETKDWASLMTGLFRTLINIC